MGQLLSSTELEAKNADQAVHIGQLKLYKNVLLSKLEKVSACEQNMNFIM